MTPAPAALAPSGPAAPSGPDRRRTNVNVVKPLQLGDDASPHDTMLDPKFSRALDFKLRRLKEKELLQTNLRRSTRPRPPHAASDPDLSTGAPSGVERKISPIAGKSPERRTRARGAADGDKPRFVTTVRSGQFLLPPPDVARVLGLDTLYSYCSRPKVVAPRTAGNVARPQGGVARLLGDVRALVAGVAGLTGALSPPAPLHAPPTAAPPTAAPPTAAPPRRVVRGSTLAHALAQGDGAQSGAARAAAARRRAVARRAAARLRPGTPPAAPGRRHHPVQTEMYLEELWDKCVELEAGVQTDLWVERPASPRYRPARSGADVATQIQPGDLFDFDVEVQPVLEVLVGKTTEQALAEVAQEEELGVLREQRRRYCELRDAELAERQRLAAHDARLHREKERRVEEARRARAAAVEARERAAAATLVQGYLAELLPDVLAGLAHHGYLLDALHTGVEEEFLPWLVEEVSAEMESLITSRDVIIEIVRDVVEARAELHRAAGERGATSGWGAAGGGSSGDDTPPSAGALNPPEVTV